MLSRQLGHGTDATVEKRFLKEVLEKKQLRNIGIKAHWFEYAVKHVHAQVKDSNKLQKYLPKSMNSSNYPNREWYWLVVATILPEWAQSYKDKVVDGRRETPQELPQKERTLKVSDKWLAKLKEHDYKSKSKCYLT